MTSGTGRRRPRTARVAAVAAVAAAAVLAMTTACQTSPPPSPGGGATSPPTGPVFTVNGEPVDAREFSLQMGTNRAQVLQYFHDHYGGQDSAGFWTTSHDGVTPLTMIKQLTMQQLVRLTVQLEMARAHGLVKEITYEAMTANLRQENQRRAAAVAEHRPVYGLTSFTEATYFSYVTSNVEANLRQDLAETMQPPATAVLEQLYRQLRSQDFTCPEQSQKQPGESPDISHYCANGEKYLPFAVVESEVLQDWKESQIEASIAANIRAADIQINHTVFDKVVAP